MTNILRQARADKKKFLGELAANGWFWDVNNLHNRFAYDRAFTPAQIRARWAEHFGRGAAVPTDFYLHVPFCASRCEYCHFFLAQSRSPEKVDAYLACLEDQFRYFAPVFRGREFRHLYVGGGTPSMLTDAQLRRLLRAVYANFGFSGRGQRTIEANPHTARPSFFGLVRRFGFNRVSFGVQTLNPAALAVNKRDYQSEARIVASIDQARAAGIADINVDLIAGLAGDTDAGFLYSFARLARLKPDNIVLYGFMPPRGGYLEHLLKMTRREFYSSYYPALVRRTLPLLGRLAGKYGYEAESCDPARWHWGYKRAGQDAGASGSYGGEYSGCIFGLGHGARSRIHNLLEYREEMDLDAPAARPPVFAGRLSDRREEMIKYVVNSLDQDCVLRPARFAAVFGEPPEKAFPYAVPALKALGALRGEAGELRFRIRKFSDKYVFALYFFSPRNAKPARGAEAER